MRKSIHNLALILLVFTGLAAGQAAAQAPQNAEVRAYLALPTGVPGALALADLTWQQSNVRKAHVCPLCGYSSDVAGVPCPDPWGLGHAATTLVAVPDRERVVNIPEWDMPVAQSDLRWYSYVTGGVIYRAVVGLPFHPTTINPATGNPFDPATEPGDPRGYGKLVYARAAINLPLDVDGDTVADIPVGAQFRFLFVDPSQNVAAAEAAGYASPPLVLTPATNVLDGSLVPFPLPEDIPGLWRVLVEWSTDGGTTWEYEENTATIESAFYVSRLQVPWTGDTWRQGPAEQTTIDSFLARVLVGPVVGGFCDDLYMPGASTCRRSFTLISRASDSTRIIENVGAELLQSVIAPPGVWAAARPTVRPSIADSAVTIGPTGAGRAAVAAGAVDTGRWVQIAIPKYQPSSEPGNTLTLPRLPANNWGYRGLALVFADDDDDGDWEIDLSDEVNPSSDSVEEFAAFDVQVSVDKSVGLAATSGTAEPGRVSPGVPAAAPDSTVVAAGGVPLGRFPFGSDVSRLDDFTLANEGNVATTPTLLVPNQAMAEPVEADRQFRSQARLLSANPVWLPPLAYTFLPASLRPGLAGAGAGFGEEGWAGAGTMPIPTIPLGQGLGQYAGQVVYFLDLNSDGNLNFIDGLTGAVTSTLVAWFDPQRDEPLEPVASLPTSLRVTEGRLPFNDYYAADTEPALRFDYGPAGVANLQVMWVSNRASVALGGGAVNVAAPAGTAPGATALAEYPGNILYGNATPMPAGDYRPYAWAAPTAFNVTGTTAAAYPGSVNSSPETYDDLSGNHWLVWHRSLRQGGRVESTLHYESSANPGWAGPDNFIYATGLPKQGIRGFADPTGSGHWWFWYEGEEGHQAIHYRWDFTGTPDDNEAPVPVSNAVSAELRTDVIADFSSGVMIRKPATTPFIYTDDPCAFLWTPPPGLGMGTQVNVVFSGYLARQLNEDICWAAFDQANMSNPAANYGKLTFPRLVNNPVLPVTNPGVARAGEQLEGDGLRQVFSSRHLDWMVSSTFESAPVPAVDPQLYLGLVYAGAPSTPILYQVSWASASYSRARGVYRGVPVFTPIPGGPALPGTGVIHDAGVLRNPLGGGNPVVMEIEPSTGTVTFSAPLFNDSNPADLGAVFNTTEPGLGTLTNVMIYADYTPFIFRLTTSDAADDSPNAFAEIDATDPYQLRLVFLWRRSYSQKDTPHFGRTSFMYKTWTLGTQVARPPIAGGLAVAAWTGVAFAPLTLGTDYTVNPSSGIITVTADGYAGGSTDGVFWLQSAFDGARVQIGYTDGLGAGWTEEHRVIGWSQETPVPVDTVQNEGPVRAVPEIYTVSTETGAAVSAVRYWLAWSSPRPVYDLRLPGAGGSVVHQSSDIYLGAVVPHYGVALREQEIEWQNVE